MTDVVSTEGVMGGQPRLDGHRISVVQIFEWVREEGMDVETVAAEFDLDVADVYRALTYCSDNVDEMRIWREQRDERIRRGREEQLLPDTSSETS